MSTTAWAQKDLTKDQVAAYVAVVQADLARDAGTIEEARRLYQVAADLYTAIAQTDPNWYPDIVQYRLSYCRSQLAALKGRAEGERPPAGQAAAQGAPDPATAEALQRLSQLESENEELRNEQTKARELLASLEADLDAMQKARLEAPELHAARDEIRGLLEQVSAFSNQVTALEEQYRVVTGQLAVARGAEQALDKQLKQAQRDSTELAKLREENEELKKDLKAAKESAKKRRADSTEDLAAKLAEWEQTKAALQQDLLACQRAREELELQLTEARKAAESAPSSEDPLPTLKAQLAQAREALTEAGRKLDESRAAALELLRLAAP